MQKTAKNVKNITQITRFFSKLKKKTVWKKNRTGKTLYLSITNRGKNPFSANGFVIHILWLITLIITFIYFFLISGQFDDYVEVDDNEKGPQSEQKIWEKKKERQAQYSFVSEDKRRKQEEKSKKYDLILDDEIEFIQALKMPGKKTLS